MRARARVCVCVWGGAGQGICTSLYIYISQADGHVGTCLRAVSLCSPCSTTPCMLPRTHQFCRHSRARAADAESVKRHWRATVHQSISRAYGRCALRGHCNCCAAPCCCACRSAGRPCCQRMALVSLAGQGSVSAFEQGLCLWTPRMFLVSCNLVALHSSRLPQQQQCGTRRSRSDCDSSNSRCRPPHTHGICAFACRAGGEGLRSLPGPVVPRALLAALQGAAGAVRAEWHAGPAAACSDG